MQGSAVRPWLGAVCLFVAAAGAPAVVSAASSGHLLADPLQADLGGRGAVLYATADGARVELTPDGTQSDLPRPRDAAAGSVDYSSLALVDVGWAAAGGYQADDGHTRLVVQRGGAAAVRSLPEPPGQHGRLRVGPVLLVDGGRLAGLAWLEGDDYRSLAVLAAPWDGAGWGAVERVAPPGPGSQVALTGAVLADGSWMLAWSAYDGGDDEIVWARRVAGSWLPSARLSPDNGVPDVTPALVATRDGALIAWSRYDGDQYRLRLARFDGEAWRDDRWVGPTASLFPSFSGDPGQPRLLYRDARAGVWSLLELDPRGEERARRSTAPEASRLRPVVAGEGESVRLLWPGLGVAAQLRAERAAGAER